MKGLILSIVMSVASLGQTPHALAFVVDTSALAQHLGLPPVPNGKDVIEVFVGGFPAGQSVTIDIAYEYDGKAEFYLGTQIQGEYDMGVLIWIADASKAKVMTVAANGKVLFKPKIRSGR